MDVPVVRPRGQPLEVLPGLRHGKPAVDLPGMRPERQPLEILPGLRREETGEVRDGAEEKMK